MRERRKEKKKKARENPDEGTGGKPAGFKDSEKKGKKESPTDLFSGRAQD